MTIHAAMIRDIEATTPIIQAAGIELKRGMNYDAPEIRSLFRFEEKTKLIEHPMSGRRHAKKGEVLPDVYAEFTLITLYYADTPLGMCRFATDSPSQLLIANQYWEETLKQFA